MTLTGLIGKKHYPSQGFLQDGTRVPLTAISAMGNMVTQLKKQDKEGYNAIKLGFDIKKKKNKAGFSPRFFKEIRADEPSELQLGSNIQPSDVFKPGDIVDVTGVSKGKGFAGVVKRHHFKGGPRTHGQSDRERAPGSIGQTTTPGRVYKGKRMAGRMGQERVTVKNLEVLDITADGVLLIKGLIPGGRNTIVVIKKVGENKKFIPLYKEVSENSETLSEPVKSDESVKSEGQKTASEPVQNEKTVTTEIQNQTETQKGEKDVKES